MFGGDAFPGMPYGIAVSGENGYWGASARTAELTALLIQALTDGADASAIVREISEELTNEYGPTPDQMDFDEDAYWEVMWERQQRMWEEDAGLGGDVGISLTEGDLGWRELVVPGNVPTRLGDTRVEVVQTTTGTVVIRYRVVE
jgi:hypothetical protein